MSASQVARHILGCCKSIHEFQVFMFGSSLYGVGSDIDILIVGQSGESLSRLKTDLRFAAEEIPLDILCMLTEEAEETQFVVREGCVPLADVAAAERWKTEVDGQPDLH